MQGDQGSARTEAERLVATVLAMASASGFGGSSGDAAGRGGLGGLGDFVTGMVGAVADKAAPSAAGGWSTGTAQCCVCPICKVIAGLRDPSPQTAERLATGAGDFAAGVASLLRAFATATATGSPDSAGSPGSTGSPDSAGSPDSTSSAGPAAPADDDPWAAATAADHTVPERVTVPRPTRRPAAASANPVPRPAPGADPWAAATTNHDAGTGDEARPDAVV